ncbi:MAG TPA: hypothetical protein PLD20_35050 [Blastocatellia bacterium]|nr:hypothetical protein [Blastocatellia bacterium]HMX29299.1 hypothetical protein [Blastocatellia bacterium]HMY73677.1 hypothetical protein [Blastocatellia bacterium]HMZ23195.1 hypothetical protein [Blastocatellia bacterium]HNG33224.1 hypothetical protein [Blastocatellia bacterium]
MTKSERKSLRLDYAPNHSNANGQSSGLGECRKLWPRVKASLQNPLTFILLVWAAMFAVTIVLLAFID